MPPKSLENAHTAWTFRLPSDPVREGRGDEGPLPIHRKGVDLVEDHMDALAVGPIDDFVDLPCLVDPAQRIVRRGEQQGADRATGIGEGAVEQLGGQTEAGSTRAVDRDDGQPVSGLQVGPESGIRRRRNQDPVARIAQHIEQGFEHRPGARQEGEVLRIDRATDEGSLHERTDPGSDPRGPHHGVVAERSRRHVRDRAQALENQVGDELVLGRAQRHVPARVVIGVERIGSALLMGADVLGRRGRSDQLPTACCQPMLITVAVHPASVGRADRAIGRTCSA